MEEKEPALSKLLEILDIMLLSRYMFVFFVFIISEAKMDQKFNIMLYSKLWVKNSEQNEIGRDFINYLATKKANCL